MSLRTFLKDLVSTPDGKVSHSKLWSNLGFVVASFIVVYLTIVDKLTIEYFLVYIASTVSNSTASKIIAVKYGTTSTPNKQTEDKANANPTDDPKQ